MPILTIPNEFVNGTIGATTLAAGAKPVDGVKISANFAEVEDLLDGNLDGDNFKPFSERKVEFDGDAGHDHDGSNSKAITGSPESGLVFSTTAGHRHDGSDSALLSIADEDQQGFIKVKTGTTAAIAYGGSQAIDIDPNFANVYAVKVWRVIAGAAGNFGLGGINAGDPPTNPLNRLGYYFKLNVLGVMTRLTIYNLTAGGGVSFKYAVLYV
jgi:hypothetical protein